jgi:hypothetical protein
VLVELARKWLARGQSLEGTTITDQLFFSDEKSKIVLRAEDNVVCVCRDASRWRKSCGGRGSAFEVPEGHVQMQARGSSGAVCLGRWWSVFRTLLSRHFPSLDLCDQAVHLRPDPPKTPAPYSPASIHPPLPRPSLRPRLASRCTKYWYGHSNRSASTQLQPTSAHRSPVLYLRAAAIRAPVCVCVVVAAVRTALLDGALYRSTARASASQQRVGASAA